MKIFSAQKSGDTMKIVFKFKVMLIIKVHNNTFFHPCQVQPQLPQ